MYLDSAILVKLVVREPDSGFYVELVDGQASVRASELSITECRAALMRKWKEGELDTRTRDQAWKRLLLLWGDDAGLLLQPVTRAVLREAGEVVERCVERVSLRTLDAIHLATCLLSQSYPLVTNDRVMRTAAKWLGVPLGALPPR